jgi:CBS-domain-containing membrane protein
MNASEVMLPTEVTLQPDMDMSEAIRFAANSKLDVIPVVDEQGIYHGAVEKSALVDHAHDPHSQVRDVCCGDAFVCAPNYALEHLKHDAMSPITHHTVMVVEDDGRYRGVIPYVHWAVDEAKTQSGHPRNRMEARTMAMHLIWKCLDCGELVTRNEGIPSGCPHCGAPSTEFALHTED